MIGSCLRGPCAGPCFFTSAVPAYPPAYPLLTPCLVGVCAPPLYPRAPRRVRRLRACSLRSWLDI
jgi:hypothetical protein